VELARTFGRWRKLGCPTRLAYSSRESRKKPEYRALQPSAKVPILEEDGLVLFESGAIVLHIGERCEAAAKEAGARARANAVADISAHSI